MDLSLFSGTKIDPSQETISAFEQRTKGMSSAEKEKWKKVFDYSATWWNCFHFSAMLLKVLPSVNEKVTSNSLFADFLDMGFIGPAVLGEAIDQLPENVKKFFGQADDPSDAVINAEYVGDWLVKHELATLLKVGTSFDDKVSWCGIIAEEDEEGGIQYRPKKKHEK